VNRASALSGGLGDGPGGGWADAYTEVMPAGFLTRSVGAAANRIPGLRRVPVFKLLAAGEVLLLAREHLRGLTPSERGRLLELVRRGRGRPSNLSEPERLELTELIAKLEPRLLAGEAVNKLSPLPLPQRLVYGSSRPHG
jgi:hypothetical protein